MRTLRYAVNCFNVGPSTAEDLKFYKRGGGEFEIKHMDAAFDKEAQFGEFFIEF